ncbi:MAG: tyrosine-type recombinase/integrase, partial [Prosthecobacter sp.]|nr:tyrosine-type recombinase/integrase [Prosthecobacter sp.]
DGVNVAELGRRWLANLKAQGCRATTLVERGHKADRMAADMGEKSIASVTREEIEAWLTSKKLTGATWDGYRRAYRAMFQFAVKNRLLESNPAAAIDPMRTDEKLPTPLSVKAAESILRTAEKYAPIMVPTLAVGFFAGLRPGEALGLDWNAIDFKQKIIRVMPETSKVRRSRIIEMNQTLIDWLLPYRKLAGPIGIQTPSQFNFYMFRKPIGTPYEQAGIAIAERPQDERPKGIIKAAGVKWIQDGPRKTFATMHFATNGDAGKLAGILGHTGDASILYKHYRGLATKADGKRYWKIRPASKGAAVLVGNFKKAVG